MITPLPSAFRALLLQSSDVTDLIDQRIFTDQMPQTADAPAVAFFVVAELANDTLGGPLGFDSASMQVESIGRTRIEAEQVWQVVRKQLAGYRGVVDGVKMVISQGSGRYFLTDRPETGSDIWRYKSVQDFSVYYQSLEIV